MDIQYLLDKSLDDKELTAAEIASLFDADIFSDEYGRILSASRRKSTIAGGGAAEVHAQVGLNIAPCPRNCSFCAFAAKNGIFKENIELSPGEAIAKAKVFERDGANAIYFMVTAQYSFDKFCEISHKIRSALKPDTIMIANIGDFSSQQAEMLKHAGYYGIYHAVRLGEGRDNDIPVDKRFATFEAAKEAGLVLGTCVEPVGPEHDIAELVEKTIITRDANPAYSGAARRILIPGTEIAKRGIVTEARMALIIAVVRLALPMSIPGNCTHEPTVLGATAGANLLWAESGSNPRDTQTETDNQRGMTVEQCRECLREGEWEIFEGPSAFFRAKTELTI